jgi:hypothetical protein
MAAAPQAWGRAVDEKTREDVFSFEILNSGNTRGSDFRRFYLSSTMCATF